MHEAKIRIRTLMIAVAVVGMECALTAYALCDYFQVFGPIPISAAGWGWIFGRVLTANVIGGLPVGLVFWHLWRFTSRLFRACDAAARRYHSHRKWNVP